jgi:alkylated DNA repair protein (DNA oxidative demethylase)
MSVEIVCLGWHWYPYRYSRTVDDGDGRPVDEFPTWLGDLGRRAVADALAVDGTVAGAATARPVSPADGYRPDVALVNWYGPGARMGMHADRQEASPAPVVSLSLGDSCLFRFGSTESRGRPWTDVVLESGDLFVFGGPSRRAYHGVPKVLPGTAPTGAGVAPGRFNLTLRESGLADAEGARPGLTGSSGRTDEGMDGQDARSTR